MKIGFCSGCFDGLHYGHQQFLAQALQGCDHLIVGLNSDQWCKKHKGGKRPLYSLVDRMLMIQEFCGPTTTIVPFEGDHNALIEVMRPNIVFAGWDQSADY